MIKQIADLKSTKLFKVLSQFDVIELNRLAKFIHSPYFNASEKIGCFFDVIYSYLKSSEPDHEKLQKGFLWKKLEGDEKYNDRRFRKYTSDLLSLVEEFLAIEKYKSNPINRCDFLLQAVQEKKLDVLYSKSIKSARRVAKRQPDRSSNFYFYQYKIEKCFYQLSEVEIQRTERSNIDILIQNLDYYYLAEKLKYYCTFLSHRKTQKHEYTILFIDEILQHIEKEDYSNRPQIMVYYHVYKLYDSLDNTSNYYALKKMIKKNSSIFSPDDLRDIYLWALNFCIAKNNKGDTKFLFELFEIYRQALYAEVLYIDNELSPWSFKNIVLTGLRAGEDTWVEDFIRKYASRLNEEYRENAVKFNMARLHHYRQEYEKVIPLLNEVEFTDFSYSLGAKALLLATYYELDELDALHSFLDSFQVYLNRHKKSLPENRRQNYLNLVKYVRRISNMLPGDKEGIEKVESEIKNQAKIADKKWLIEKIRELK
jgi:hypothetical protein